MRKDSSNKILVVGDLHMKEFLSYSDYVEDKRVAEKKEIMGVILKASKDCNTVVFLGDNFDHKNNSSEVTREFVSFLESFGDKELYILSGNHEKKGNGSTAIDFLGEIKKPNWHIITKPQVGVSVNNLKVDFLPYMLRSELGTENEKDSASKIMDEVLQGGDILFHHHTIEGKWGSLNTGLLSEIVLSCGELMSKYKLILGGHIHTPSISNNVYLTGSIFNSHVGETGKFIHKIDTDTLNVEKISLPGRKIYGLENPTKEDLDKLEKNSIIKVVITDKTVDVDSLRKELSNFDTYLLTEQYPNTRKRVKFDEGELDLGIESLLKIYAENKGLNYDRLLSGYIKIKCL